MSCYSWLQAIDEDNEAYADYGEQLYEKANIVATFQDSPCESRKERYAGVKKEMFVRATDALNSHYVSAVEVDYRQMATKAIKRCKLLAEVIVRSFAQISQAENASEESWFGKESFLPPNSEELASWSSALDTILDELDQSLVVDKYKFIEIFYNLINSFIHSLLIF